MAPNAAVTPDALGDGAVTRCARLHGSKRYVRVQPVTTPASGNLPARRFPMSNRSRIVLGSLGGAFAIHLAALACSGNHSVVDSRDASMADAGAAQQHDGGFVDVITSAIDAVGDAMGGMVRDVATQVVDGEVRDAHAGGDPVRTMEAPCNVHSTTGGPPSWLYATFTVPGLNPETAGEIHARVCGYTCAADAGYCTPRIVPGSPTCLDTAAYTGPGIVTVYCGQDSDHGTTARIWLH